jgi:hypothetical protein
VSDVVEAMVKGADSFDLEPIVLSSAIVMAARNIYQAYVKTHGSKQTPLGVALNRYTLRGQLIFASQPILLPHECFVTMRDIDMFDVNASEE